MSVIYFINCHLCLEGRQSHQYSNPIVASSCPMITDSRAYDTRVLKCTWENTETWSCPGYAFTTVWRCETSACWWTERTGTPWCARRQQNRSGQSRVVSITNSISKQNMILFRVAKWSFLKDKSFKKIYKNVRKYDLDVTYFFFTMSSNLDDICHLN